MNLTTKLLVIFNLILAIGCSGVFATWYATGENWKRRWDQDTTNLSETIIKLEGRYNSVSFQLADSRSNLSSAKNTITELQHKSSTLTNDLVKKEGELEVANGEIHAKMERIQALEFSLEAKDSSLREARQRNSELNHIAQVSRAVAHELDVKLSEAEEDINQLTTLLTKREETINLLETDNKHMKARLELIRQQYPRVYDEIVDQKGADLQTVHGIVNAISTGPDGQQDFVMLSVGSDDHVEEGMEFIVYRGATYVVKVRAERVLKDMVACRIMPESWNNAGLEVSKGDQAQNRIR